MGGEGRKETSQFLLGAGCSAEVSEKPLSTEAVVLKSFGESLDAER